MNFLYLEILYYITILIWLFPPIMQYGEKYFYFFLLLAFSDLSVLALHKLFQINSSYIHLLVIYFAYLSVLSKETLKKYKYLLLFLVLIILFCFFIINKISINYFIFIIINFLIFLRILLTFITEIELEKTVKIFLIIFLLYELTVILKFINIITGFTNAYFYFFVTTVFEIFFGLFFSIFKEGDTRVVLKLE